jgi:hypothetical protein
MAITYGFKTHCFNKDAFIHISTSTFSSDVGRPNHPLLGPSVPAGDPYEIFLFLVSLRVPAGDPHGLMHAPHLKLGNDQLLYQL